MPVIDSHHHFWWTARRPHIFPPHFGTSLERDFTPKDLIPELRRARIDGTVLVQSVNDFDETLEYLDLAHQYDFVRGVVGWVPMEDPEACARALEQLLRNRKVVGIRHLSSFDADPGWMQRRPVTLSIEQIAKANLVLEAIPNTPDQLDSFLKVGDAFPGLKLNLNHLGRPPLPEQGWEPWASQMKRAAENPNISVKLSTGGNVASRWKWSTEEMRPYTDHVLGLFGTERVMAGSNWPVILLGGPFADVWGGIEDLLANLSTAERDAVLGGTVERIYRLPK